MPRVCDDYGMVGRVVHGREVPAKTITEAEYAGEVVPPTPEEAKLPGRDYED